ncbi:response regulator [Terasakiella pusilla]|uniref:response regulator n=1 Tax=Terasakiella pusilla TaxID=64973 RepID=UPI003AA86A52
MLVVKTKLTTFISTMLVIIATLIVAAILSAFWELNSFHNRNQTLHNTVLQNVSGNLKNELRLLEFDLDFLHTSDALRSYTNAPTAQNHAALGALFKTLALTSRRYDQVRLLDASGIEVLRVNYKAPNAVLVPTAQLQNKSRRYYFQEALKIEPGLTSISPLDLNVENDAVEVPHKPVIRLSRPIFDPYGNVQYVLILNYLAENLIKHVRNASLQNSLNLWLLNEKGDWLFDPQDNRAFAFQLRSHPLRVSHEMPNTWKILKENTGGKFYAEKDADEGTLPDGEPRFLQFFTKGTDYTFTKLTSANIASHPDSRLELIIVANSPTPSIFGYVMSKLSKIDMILFLLFTLAASALLAHFRTKKVMAEIDLMSQKKRLQKIYNNTSEAMVIIDQSGCIREFNPAAERIFELKADEAIGQNVHILMPPSDHANHDQHLKNYVNDRQSRLISYPRQLIAQRSNGEEFPIEINLTELTQNGETFILGNIKDISVRVANEKALKEYHETLEISVEQRTQELQDTTDRLDLALSAANIGVWEFDIEDEILVMDKRAARLLGHGNEPQKVSYRTLHSNMAPHDKQALQKALEECARNKSGFAQQFEINHPSYGRRILRSQSLYGEDKDTGKPMFTGVVDDVTAQVTIDKALEAAKNEAEKMTRLKGEFLANMSHEIRTPMNAVLGLAQLLHKPDMPEEVRELSGKILNAGQSLQDILNDILDFSKIEAGKLELSQHPFTLQELIDSIATIMSISSAHKNIDLIIHPQSSVFTSLIGDPLRLKQILINLLGNAIKFTEQGYVKLAIKTLEETEREMTLWFEVSDTGIGMSRDALKNIEQAFVQAEGNTTRKYGGTGLGLTITSKLLKMMGSELKSQSELGQGSQFSFTLTLTVDRSAQTSSPEVTNLDVVIADDLKIAQDALENTVKSLNWKPKTFSNGQDALNYTLNVSKHHKAPDILLLDWDMPVMDGLETSRLIKESLSDHNLPIIIMVTAYSKDNVLNQENAAYIDAVMEKPVTTSSLYDQVITLKNPGYKKQHKQPTTNEKCLLGLTILVVDDNEFNRDVAERILKDQGATVVLAIDGEEATRHMMETPSLFDLILMDIQMPRMDGYEATRKIREMEDTQHTPIIALTAGAFQAQKDAAFEAGMDGFVSKPFDIQLMLDTILEKTGAPPLAPPRTADEQTASATPYQYLNLSLALQLWGSEEKLAQYFQKFLSDYGEAIPPLLELGPEEAQRQLHKMKGATAALGLNNYADFLNTVEGKIHEGGLIHDFADELNQIHQQVLDEIATYLDTLPAAEVPASSAEAVKKHTATTPQDLQAKLEDQDLDASESLLQLLQESDPSNPLYPQIADALRDFDFAKAAELLSTASPESKK